MLPLTLKGSAFMTDKSSDLVQGTLDMLILKTLALEPMHGWGVAVRIERVNAVVLGCNKHHVVHASGDVHLRHEKRLAVNERINRAGKDLAECRNIHVRGSQLRLEQVRTGPL